jgi:hypothetical protein
LQKCSRSRFAFELQHTPGEKVDAREARRGSTAKPGIANEPVSASGRAIDRLEPFD